MDKHKHIIVLNGRRYNAKTGENLSRPAGPVRVPAHEASHHIPVHKSAPSAARTHRSVSRKSARQAPRHLAAHQPKPARTLMRQAVKKPPASIKRRIRVQGRLDSQIKQPVFEPPVRTHQVKHHVARGRKVHLISHFSPNLFTVTTVITTKPAPKPLISDRPIANRDTGSQPTMRPAFAPKKPRTTAELLDYAIRYADSPPEPREPARRDHHTRKRILRRRVHAVAH